MKFTIDIEDFCLDEDRDLEPALKKYIIDTVVREIWKGVEKKAEASVTKEVKDQVEKSFFRQIQSTVSEVIKTGKIKGEYNKEEITVQEWILEQFQKNSGWRSPESQLKDLAKKFGDELKARYDLMFASQIVMKLNQNGMLKEDVAKMLLQDNKTD